MRICEDQQWECMKKYLYGYRCDMHTIHDFVGT